MWYWYLGSCWVTISKLREGMDCMMHYSVDISPLRWGNLEYGGGGGSGGA